MTTNTPDKQNLEEVKTMGLDHNQFKTIDSVKIATIGNVDSGKSTLIGVLTKGLTDDGRGSARLRVFNYPHEIENGRTSSIAYEIMGFDKNGDQIVPDRFNQNKNKYWNEIVPKSSKIVSLIDLCGHEKYLKTTMFGLVGLVPDYTMIIIGANMGISRMTKEHLGITLALKIPFFIVITKTDICPQNIYKETLEKLMQILKMSSVNRKPIIVTNDNELETCSQNIQSNRICPIFCISSVTNQGMPDLTKFISLLQNRTNLNPNINLANQPVEYDIQDHFLVSGVGIVINGVVKSGTIKINDTLLIGPDKTGHFKFIIVRSIHINRVPSDEAIAGQFACLCIRPTKKDIINRSDIRKGMCILDPNLKPQATWEFEAEVVVLHHHTTVKTGYQAMIHCGVVRQNATVIDMSNEIFRSGDKGLVRFRFMYHPEYIKKGSTILLREGRTKILGVIINLITEK